MTPSLLRRIQSGTEECRRLLAENALHSSAFEGARGLPRPEAGQCKAARRSRRRSASAKNARSGA
jgi:hypothetical protein